MNRTEKNYKYLIFDADHTLLNYLEDERSAFLQLYEELGIPVSEALMKDSRHYSESKWTDAGLYDVYDERIQKVYHSLYKAHVKGVFEEIFRIHGIEKDAQKEKVLVRTLSHLWKFSFHSLL